MTKGHRRLRDFVPAPDPLLGAGEMAHFYTIADTGGVSRWSLPPYVVLLVELLRID